jgi:predicted dehydrogenase
MAAQPQKPSEPVRVAIAGLVHGHALGFFRRFGQRSDIQIVAVSEAKQDVAERYANEFNFDGSILFRDIDTALERAKPEAVMAYSDTFDHKAIVEACAKRRVPVMMEKPLAVSVEHARAIGKAAQAANIHVMVNYETTWYPTTQRLWPLVREEKVTGRIRKLIIRDGHGGPKEIGVQPEFLAWLTDPVRNGAGAMFDFGCYGANLATWLLNNERPIAVTALAQSNKPHIYAQVDDEATILLQYPGAQAIIQASWNWPYSRKDIDIYGDTGYVLAPDRTSLVIRSGQKREEKTSLPALTNEYKDEVSYLVAVVRGQAKPSGLSSLANNMIVTDILSAARQSVKTGTTVRFQRA